MAKISQAFEDPTLAAIDNALVLASKLEKARPYLGMSSIGESCSRKLWYRFRWAADETFDALSLKRFADGHASEDVQAARLRMVDGITLVTHDPDSGKQIGYKDIEDHFKGHCDGNILGILQAPKTWHIWEHKAVAEKSITELEKIKTTYGEKEALKRWKPVYYAQAILYMHYNGFTRHYMTVSSPGGRHTVSIRTNADPAEAAVLIGKARRIVYAQNPPERISRTPDFFECKWCPFNELCWSMSQPKTNCRTCLHSTPISGGEWHCARFDYIATEEEQRMGCDKHLYIPSFVPGTPIETGEDFVKYRMNDGSEFINGGE